jgi:hypothetical protein
MASSGIAPSGDSRPSVPGGLLFVGGAEPYRVSGLAVGGRRFIAVFQNDHRVTLELVEGGARGVPELSLGPSASCP